MGNSDLAIRDFTEVLNLSPRHAVAIRSRPQSYFAAGDLKRAVSDYALLIRLNPRNARAFYLRGLPERELQEFDRALDDFTRMIQIERACALRHASI
jgi:tetratricopeptide (TPR) repeat protein